jgi:hypothetical protein
MRIFTNIGAYNGKKLCIGREYRTFGIKDALIV